MQTIDEKEAELIADDAAKEEAFYDEKEKELIAHEERAFEEAW